MKYPGHTPSTITRETTIDEMTSSIHSPAANKLAFKLFTECVNNDESNNVIFSTRAIAYCGAVMSVGVGPEKQKILDSENINELLIKPLSATSECNSSITVAIYDSTRIGGTIEHRVAALVASKGLKFMFMEYEAGRVNQRQCDIINDIAKKCTEGKITNVVDLDIFSTELPKAMIRTVTKFKGKWISPFTKSNMGSFFIANHKFIDIPKMYINREMCVAISNMEQYFNATIFQLPYKNGATMIIHMPNNLVTFDDLYDLVAKKYACDDIFEKMLQSFKMERVQQVAIPKFSHTSSFDITENVVNVNPMQHLLQDPSHLFTHLEYEFVTQNIKCSIDVDEAGTESTAVYNLVCVDGGPRLRILDVNRPFLYFILDEYRNIINIFCRSP